MPCPWQPWRQWLLVRLLLCAGIASAAPSEPVGEGSGFAPSTRWRVVNLDSVTYGWKVGELRFFSDTLCTQELTRQPGAVAIASGSHGALPERAMDGLTWTEWRAQCYLCGPSEAWLGVRFGEPVRVYCVQLWQWGRREYRTSQVHLQRWAAATASSAGEWQSVLLGTGLDGDRWDSVAFTRCEGLEAPANGVVEVTNNGFYPSRALLSCSGARFLGGASELECLADGSWSGGVPRCWSMLEIIILISSILVGDIIAFVLYWYFVVSRKAPPLHHTSFVGEENMGKWSTELFALGEDPKRVGLQCLLCPCCRIAESWHGAGLVPYHFGVWVVQILPPLLPCIGALMRGWVRERFDITSSGFRDLAMWTCCLPCAAVQEAKHLDEMCKIAQEEEEMGRADALRKRQREAEHAQKYGKHDHEHVEVVKHAPEKKKKEPKLRAMGTSVLDIVDQI